MDFGVDRLVDMIEDRFGRRTSNVLLALVVVAVAGYCANLIYRFIISPITWAVLSGFRHTTNGDIAVTKWQIINWLISIGVGTALVGIYVLISSLVFRRFRRRAVELVADVKAVKDETMRQYAEVLEIQNSVTDHQRRIDEFLDFIEPLLGEHGIDAGPIREKLNAEETSNS